MFDLARLLSEGVVGQLRFGSSRKQVEELLGSAEGNHQFGGVLIEKHGAFQLHYARDQLFCVNWLLDEHDQPPFTFNGDYPKPDTSLYDFLNTCDEYATQWSVEQSLSFDRQLAIRTSTKVVAIFDLDFREIQRVIVTDHHYAP